MFRKSILIWGILLLSSASWAGSMGQLFGFGDSGIDTGNIYAVTGGLEPADPYWEGRFSNGPNYLDLLAEAVPGWEAIPWSQGGTNTAFGGTQSGLGYVPEIDIPNAGQQVVEFQAEYGLSYSSTDVILFSMGQNDLLFNPYAPPDPTIVAGNMVQAIELAYQNGARRFVFPTLFPLDLMPEVVDNSYIPPAEAAAWVDQVNAETDILLVQFQAAHPGAVIIRPDLTARLHEVYANPEKYGFTNVTESAYTGDFLGEGGSVVPDPDTYLWWDVAHMTAPVQELVAKWTLLDIQNGFFPEQSSPQAGLGSIQALMDQTMLHNQWEAGRVSLLIGPDRPALSQDQGRTGNWRFEPFGFAGRQDSSGISSGWSWRQAGFSMGREKPLSPDAAAGLALGWSRGKLDLNNGHGEADTRLYQAGLYGGVTRGSFYLSGGGRYGYADNQASRDMELTETTARHRFHTHLLSGWMETGFNLAKRTVNVSPLAGLSYVRVISGSGNESGGGLLDYDSIDYLSTHHLRHKLGGRVSGTIPGAQGPRWSAEAAWYHEYLDTQCESYVTHGAASYYFVSQSRNRDALGLAAGFSWRFGENGSLDLAYQGQWAEDALTHAANVCVAWAY